MEEVRIMTHTRRKMESSWLCELSLLYRGSRMFAHTAGNSGALEPQFFAALLKGLSLKESDLPGDRRDPSTWLELRALFTKTFKSKTRAEWGQIFDGTDACCTPVLTQNELETAGFDQRPIVTLRDTPGLAIAEDEAEGGDEATRAAKGQGSGVTGQGWQSEGLSPSAGGEGTLKEWLGWRRGKDFDFVDGGLALRDATSKL
jgi:alpha-methylacyl-CoA racemase